MEQYQFDQPTPDKLDPEPQDATDMDMERMSSRPDDGLPDFEQTTQSGLEQLRAMQVQVEKIITQVQTLLSAEKYTDESLPELLSQARILVGFSLPNSIQQYGQSELRLAGHNFSRGQKVWLFILGVIRGGSALDLFTTGIKNESTRKQVSDAVAAFNQATAKFAAFLSQLEDEYESADKRTSEEKIEDAERAREEEKERAQEEARQAYEEKEEKRQVRIRTLTGLISEIHAEIKAGNRGGPYQYQVPSTIWEEMEKNKHKPSSDNYQSTLIGMLGSAEQELEQLRNKEAKDPEAASTN